MVEATVVDGVCRLAVPDARWLATGFDGGYTDADAAYNITVPSGFDRTDLPVYADDRVTSAGFDGDGPRLLTGVAMRHARGARCGSVTAVATAGISNPAALPIDGDETVLCDDAGQDDPPPGTVNVLVGTTRALDDGSLATLLATAVEAKTATLQQLTGFTGTTTDAVAVGCVPSGDTAEFAGSGTDIGRATRACVRDAVRSSLDARYTDDDYPDSVAEAEHGVVTSCTATTFQP